MSAEVAEAVRALHRQTVIPHEYMAVRVCAEDGQTWPCQTERAIRKALGEDER